MQMFVSYGTNIGACWTWAYQRFLEFEAWDFSGADPEGSVSCVVLTWSLGFGSFSYLFRKCPRLVSSAASDIPPFNSLRALPIT